MKNLVVPFILTVVSGLLLAALYNVLPAELGDSAVNMKDLLFYGVIVCTMLLFFITGSCMPQFTLYGLLSGFGHLMAMNATQNGVLYAVVAALFYLFAIAALVDSCDTASEEPSPT